jgi:hypothetical protein
MRGVRIAAHLGLLRQFEEGQHIAASAIEEDVHIGIIGPGGGHMILGKGGGISHAQHAVIPLHRLLRIAAAVGHMVDAFEFGGGHGSSPST